MRTKMVKRVQKQAWGECEERRHVALYCNRDIEKRIKDHAKTSRKSISLWLLEAALAKLEANS